MIESVSVISLVDFLNREICNFIHSRRIPRTTWDACTSAACIESMLHILYCSIGRMRNILKQNKNITNKIKYVAPPHYVGRPNSFNVSMYEIVCLMSNLYAQVCTQSYCCFWSAT